jgi:flagellar motility protein MotE (MotC chaperone)
MKPNRVFLLSACISLVMSLPATAQAPSPVDSDSGLPAQTEIAPQICEGSGALFLAISRERDLLLQRSTDIERAEAELELVREAVLQETERLTALRDEVRGILDRAIAEEAAGVGRLVTVYETMKPEEAARLLDGLDMSVTMLIFSAMSEKRAAPILARMNEVRAQAISRILVEMAKLPGDRNLEGIRIR